MANQRIDSIISESAEQEVKNMIVLLKDMHEHITNAPKVVSMFKGAEGVADLKKAYAELDVVNKRSIDLQKQAEAQAKRLAEVENKLADAREKAAKDRKKMNDDELRASLQQSKASQDRQKELKKEIELQEAANGSIEKARAIVNDLTLKRNKLNLETEQGRQKLAEYNAEIDKQNDFIKQNVDALAKQKINIGNYQGSAKIIVDALKEVETKLESLKTKQQQLTQVQNLNTPGSMGFDLNRYKQTEAELKQVNSLLQNTQQEFEALNTITSNPKFLNIAGKMGDARTEVKGFTTTLIELEQRGLGKTSFADELRQRLAKLTDEIADTRGEIKKLSSDSYAFDQVAHSVSFLANTYQTFVGVQALVGEQNEAVEETMKKLMAVQALSNGLQQIATALTNKGTVVNKAYAYVQGLVAVATDTTATAQARLNAVLKLSTIGLVIGAVALLVSKYDEWFGSAYKITQQEKNLQDINSKVVDSFVDQKKALDNLVDPLNNNNTSLSEKKRIVKELQEQYPNYLGNLRIEKGEVVGLSEGYAKLVQAIQLKARSQAAGELLAEQEKSLMKKGLELGITSYEQADKLYEKYKDSDNMIVKIFVRSYEEAKKTRDQLTGIKADADKLMQSLGGDPTGGQQQFKDKEKAQEDAAKKARDIAERDAKARFEIYKLEQERELEILQKTIEDDKAGWVERLTAAMNYVQKKQKLIADSAAFEKATGKKTNEEKLLIDKQAAIDQIHVAEDVEKKVEEIGKRTREEVKNIDIFSSVPESSTYKQIIKQLDDYQKKQEEIAAKEKQYHEERRARLKELVAEIKETTYEFLVAPIEKQKNALQAAQDIKDKNFEKERENIQNSTLSEEEKAARIKVLESENQTQKEQNARKIRELDEKKAKFDRAKTIADIVQNTASAIMKAMAAYPGPPGFIMAGIIGGIGLAQLLRATATQIPKYFRGRSKHDPYEGDALVGDGGKSELIVRADGSVLITPDKPTLTTVKRGDTILPDASKMISFDDMQNIMTASTLRNMATITASSSNDIVGKKLDQMKQENKEMLIWQTNELKKVSGNKRAINVFVSDFRNSDYVKTKIFGE